MSKDTICDVQDIIREIRDFVTQRRIQDRLFENRKLYSQLCSCVDAASDTQQAIDAYSAGMNLPAMNNGEKYLLLYGLLQAIFVQQDAVMHMTKSLSIPDHIRDYPELFNIRETRSKSIGHPTEYTEKTGSKKVFYSSIVQYSLGKEGFEIFSYDGDGTFHKQKVDVLEIIRNQRLYIGEMLTNMLEKIKEKDREHRRKFREIQLSDCFIAPDVFYHCSKVLEVLISDDPVPEFGKASVISILTTLKSFEERLNERGVQIKTYPGIQLTFDDCLYPLERLQEYFDAAIRGEIPSIDEKTASIFSEYLRGKIEELHTMAKEIDEEYRSET